MPPPQRTLGGIKPTDLPQTIGRRLASNSLKKASAAQGEHDLSKAAPSSFSVFLLVPRNGEPGFF